MSIDVPAREAEIDLDPVRLLGLAVAMPHDSSLRLDQPCAREHGSLGGWSSDGAGEVAYTLLWRPLAYWTREPVEAPGPDGLQRDFVEQALAGTRKDSRAMSIDERASARVGGHAGDLVDTTIQVRRKVGRVSLRRRQVLWTCPATGRHLAFEVSALLADADRVAPVFEAILATVRCHEGGTP